MTTYLVRHAKAGSRGRWNGPDHERLLSSRGEQQSKKIAKFLVKKDITHIISSPYARCLQTVAHLSSQTGVETEARSELGEGSPPDKILNLLTKISAENAVLCSHGDVIGIIMNYVESLGVNLDSDRSEKGSIWVLDFSYGQVINARYIEPPQ